MMTLKRFRELAGSYGGDLARWPEDMRIEARSCLAQSLEARKTLADEQALDDALEAAGIEEDEALWKSDDQTAALARLRAGVAARIALEPPRSVAASTLDALYEFIAMPRLGLLGLAGSGMAAVVAGLLIGASFLSTPSRPDDLVTMLQPDPPISVSVD